MRPQSRRRAIVLAAAHSCPRTLPLSPLIIPASLIPTTTPRLALTAEAGSKVSLQVNKLWSAKTQLTYSYYSLPFCKPDVIVEEKENLGQVSTQPVTRTQPGQSACGWQQAA